MRRVSMRSNALTPQTTFSLMAPCLEVFFLVGHAEQATQEGESKLSRKGRASLCLSNMTPDLEDQVNEAIEFFPGRVKRDEWVKQAAELAK